MPLNPQDFRLKPAIVDRCERMLEKWDTRDPWHATSSELGQRLIALTYEACAPAVPLLASPEAAAKFLCALLERPSATPQQPQDRQRELIALVTRDRLTGDQFQKKRREWHAPRCNGASRERHAASQVLGKVSPLVAQVTVAHGERSAARRATSPNHSVARPSPRQNYRPNCCRSDAIRRLLLSH